jgi:hypothetical protein
MAKRTPGVEEPYNPLDASLAQSVLRGPSAAQESTMRVRGGEDYGTGPEPRGGPTKDSVTRVISMSVARNSSKPEKDGTERRCREKRVVLSRCEERQVERLVDRMADELKTSLKLSHVLRAAVCVLLHAEEEIIRRLESDGPLERPSNWDPVALARFEHELAKILSMALRDAPPLR